MIFQLFWLIFIISAFLPLLRQRRINNARFQLISNLQKKRSSRVITMIHRQEFLSILGLPFNRYITIEDSEALLRAIRLTPDEIPIDLVLHTPGGLVLASEQIAHALQKHPSKVTVFVPHYAMSGGTMIALAADEIIMDENAVLGPVDPQIGQYPAVSILKAVEQKSIDEIEDRTLILADIAEKALEQVEETVFVLLTKHFDGEKARDIARILSRGHWTHDFPITCHFLRDLGLRINNDMLGDIYTLMDLYPQQPQRRPSVQYIPVQDGMGGKKGD